MGLVDVTEILSDPDLVNPITIVHRSSYVDLLGENRIKEDGEPSFGVIYPASGSTLYRLPEAFRVARVMSFVVKGKVVSDGCDKYPDILILNGVRYAVQVIFDYTNWGEGFCEGTCVREKPTL